MVQKSFVCGDNKLTSGLTSGSLTGGPGWDIHSKTLIYDELCGAHCLSPLSTAKIQIRVRHVPVHVGVYDNEKTDRLTKAAVRRAHLAATRTEEQRQDQALEALAESIIAAILNR